MADAARSSDANGKDTEWRCHDLGLDIHSPATSLASTWAHIHAGEFEKAWAVLVELRKQELSPGVSDSARKAMGHCAFKNAECAKSRDAHDQAFDWLGKAVELIPEFPAVQLEWGQALLRRECFADAWDAMVCGAEVAWRNPALTEKIRRGMALSARRFANHFEFGGGRPSVEGTDWRSAARWREESLRHDSNDAFAWRRYVWDLVYCERFADAEAAMAAVPSAEIGAHLSEYIGDMPAILKQQVEGEVSIFRVEAPRYRTKDLPVVPVRGKVVIPQNWEAWGSRMPSEADYRRWDELPGANIGLVLGPLSGVSIVDIDTDEPEVVAVFLAHLPRSPWRRFGRRGMALAYRWTGLPNQDYCEGERHKPLFDILGGPAFILLPPSLHPQTGRPYSASCDLLDVLDDLPDLPGDFVETVVAALRAAGRDVRLRAPAAKVQPTAAHCAIPDPCMSMAACPQIHPSRQEKFVSAIRE